MLRFAIFTYTNQAESGGVLQKSMFHSYNRVSTVVVWRSYKKDRASGARLHIRDRRERHRARAMGLLGWVYKRGSEYISLGCHGNQQVKLLSVTDTLAVA